MAPDPGALRVSEVVGAVAAGAGDAMLVLDPGGFVVFANEAAEALLAMPAAALSNRAVETLVLGAAEIVRLAASRRFAPPIDTAEPGWTAPRPVLVRRGQLGAAVEVRASTVVSEGETFVCLSLRHADSPGPGRASTLPGRHEVEAALEQQAGITGLIVVDIDHFELVNESFGRASGDQLLIEIGAVLSGLAGERETVARLEADRFALVLRSDPSRMNSRADRALEAIRANRWRIGDSVVRLTASAGCCRIARRGAGEERILDAEAALRRAKEAGRDRRFEQRESTRVQALATNGWTDRVRAGIEGGALLPHFQPVLDLRTGEINHYELLARMRAEDGQLIHPSSFIPVAERLGMIGMIDRWAIETAIKTLAAWPAPGGPRIAVNTSGRSVGCPRVLAFLKDRLRAHGVTGDRVIVEVTETAAIGSIEDAAAFGDELRAMGTGFALDDFGSGFGTLYYLKHLPLDQVKIDGEFISSVGRSASDQLFVSALVGIAKGLGLKTVAEYVGDSEGLEVLRELGIDYAQGYHVGRPGPLTGLG